MFKIVFSREATASEKIKQNQATLTGREFEKILKFSSP